MPFPPLIRILSLIIKGMARVVAGITPGARLRSEMLAGAPPLADCRIPVDTGAGINGLQYSALHGPLAIPDGFWNIAFRNYYLFIFYIFPPPPGRLGKTAGNQFNCAQGSAAQRVDSRKGAPWNS